MKIGENKKQRIQKKMSGKDKNQENVALQFKYTHWEKAPSNKIPALTKSMNMDIWLVGTSNQLLYNRF